MPSGSAARRAASSVKVCGPAGISAASRVEGATRDEPSEPVRVACAVCCHETITGVPRPAARRLSRSFLIARTTVTVPLRWATWPSPSVTVRTTV